MHCYEPLASTHHRVTPNLHEPAGELAADAAHPTSLSVRSPYAAEEPSVASHRNPAYPFLQGPDVCASAVAPAAITLFPGAPPPWARNTGASRTRVATASWHWNSPSCRAQEPPQQHATTSPSCPPPERLSPAGATLAVLAAQTAANTRTRPLARTKTPPFGLAANTDPPRTVPCLSRARLAADLAIWNLHHHA